MSIPKVVNVESVLQQLATAAVIYPHLAVFAEAGVLIEAMRRQLAPEHSAPTGETVRVRACVGRDEEGRCYVFGDRIDEQGDEDRMETVRDADYEPVCFIEADVPVRTFPTIEAAVVEAKETNHA